MGFLAAVNPRLNLIVFRMRLLLKKETFDPLTLSPKLYKIYFLFDVY
jgi:hypothetical protein